LYEQKPSEVHIIVLSYCFDKPTPMKKVHLFFVLLVLLSTGAHAQFDFASKPFKAPKNTVNLAKASENVVLKVGQTAYYPWVRTSDDDSFSISITEGLDNVERKGAHIYKNPKNSVRTTTWQYVAVKEGTAKMEIEDEQGKNKIISIKIVK